jgi:hypothetical protein
MHSQYYMEVSSQLHALATLSLGKEPPVPIGYDAGWAQELVLTLWRRRRRDLVSAGNRTVIPPSSSP